MSVVVGTNTSSINATRILDKNSRDMQRTMERLSSGKRINAAADDAAGMAVAAKMRAEIRSLNQAIRNVNDAISLVNTYDGASAEIETMLVRLRELAVQAATNTYSDSDRKLADTEVKQLLSEIDKIDSNTVFNGKVLAGNPFTFRLGARSGSDDDETSTLGSLDNDDLGIDGGTDVSAVTIASQGGASSAVAVIDAALDDLAGHRATAGAFVNRLGHRLSNLQNISQRTQEALSGIEDADYAAESASLARGMVLAQAGTAMLAQANQKPMYILALLA